MPDYPTFFFSHARQDSELPGRYLIRFFEDLERVLATWAGVALEERRLGTIDKRVRHGADWNEQLSQSLSADRALLAVYTPLYFTRPNCGKELGVFLMRIPDLGIDTNGGLTRVRNVIPIRWLAQEAYAANTGKDSLIPPILRLIEDTPPDTGDDDDRRKAIERYRKKGMSACVTVEPHYRELLDLFAQAIRDLNPLPSAANASFAGALNAFQHDWTRQFTAAGTSVETAPSAVATVPLEPRALTSVVAFHLTRREVMIDSAVVSFADKLIAEPISGLANTMDAEFAALLGDIRAAAIAEGLTIFHAAPAEISADPAALIGHLRSLTGKSILTMLVIDPAVWPDGSEHLTANAIDQIIRSQEWVGTTVMPSFGRAQPANIAALMADRDLPARLLSLPQVSSGRIELIRAVMVDTRGRLLARSGEASGSTESLPLLKGVSEEDE